MIFSACYKIAMNYTCSATKPTGRMAHGSLAETTSGDCKPQLSNTNKQ
eukprot:IDg3962t1